MDWTFGSIALLPKSVEAIWLLNCLYKLITKTKNRGLYKLITKTLAVRIEPIAAWNQEEEADRHQLKKPTIKWNGTFSLSVKQQGFFFVKSGNLTGPYIKSFKGVKRHQSYSTCWCIIILIAQRNGLMCGLIDHIIEGGCSCAWHN